MSVLTVWATLFTAIFHPKRDEYAQLRTAKNKIVWFLPAQSSHLEGHSQMTIQTVVTPAVKGTIEPISTSMSHTYLLLV
jgi:hypothetical protein